MPNKIYATLLKNQFQPKSSFSLTLLSHPLTLPFYAQTLSSHSLKQLSHPSHTSPPLSLSNSNYMYSLVPLHQLTPLSLSHHSLSLSLILLFSIIHSHHFLILPFHQVLPHFYTPLSILYQPLSLIPLFQPLSLQSRPTFSLSHHFQPTLPNLSAHFLSLSPHSFN